MSRNILAVLVAAIVVALSPSANAGWGIVDLEIGVKGGAHGNIWTEPEDLPLYLGGQDWAFGGLRGGYGGGGGIYAQLRLWKALGLEIDILVDETRMSETPIDGQTWRVTARALNLRIPILVQGILPLPGIRLGVVVGPEFVVPLTTWAEQSNQVPGVSYPFEVDSRVSTLITTGLNFTVALGAGVTLPIDLRASYNLTQPRDYEGRVEVFKDDRGRTNLAEGIRVTYQDTWDFRLMIGVGYGF
jgi:hypothetical protein